jgi:hypothetical protein
LHLTQQLLAVLGHLKLVLEHQEAQVVEELIAIILMQPGTLVHLVKVTPAVMVLMLV